MNKSYDSLFGEIINGYLDSSGFSESSALCESHIESIMLASLWFRTWYPDSIVRGGQEDYGIEEARNIKCPSVSFLPQTKIGKYRADIAIVVTLLGERLFLVVECDGHEYHEKTKEQAARDKARDRSITAAGWRIFRFTGSEIWKDPIKCGDEIESFIYKWQERVVSLHSRKGGF